MFVSEDLHQNRDAEFIQDRKCDIKLHITLRENSNLRVLITIYSFISGALLAASLLLWLCFGNITKAYLLCFIYFCLLLNLLTRASDDIVVKMNIYWLPLR
jgi:hypothetical protein